MARAVTGNALRLLADALADMRPTVDDAGLSVPITNGAITITPTDALDHPSGDVDGYAVTVATPAWTGTPAIADIDCIPAIVRTLATIWSPEAR